MKPKRTWILVADGARARIVLAQGRGRNLEPAVDREFVGPRLTSGDLASDRPGRVDRRGMFSHAFAPQTDPAVHERASFIREVASVVEAAADRRAFDRLVVVAPPPTLGRLRTALSARTRALVTAEIGKDLTGLTLADLQRRLAAALPL